MRPSEAFLTLYLTGEWKNLTIEQVSNEIYPWWTYSYLIWLVPVFLLTDFLRYKPILVVDGAAAIGTWALLLWAQGVVAMMFVEVLYGLFTAGEVAYYSYLYVEVPKEHFKKVSSFTRAATLVGKFVSFLLAQFLYSFNVMDYYELHVFSFVSVCVAFIVPLVLPWPEHSEIFHRRRHADVSQSDVTSTDCKKTNSQKEYDAETGSGDGSVKIEREKHENENTPSGIVPVCSENTCNSNDVTEHEIKDLNVNEHRNNFKQLYEKGEQDTSDSNIQPTLTENKGCREGFLFIWKEMKEIYTSRVVLVWSIWWAIASCGNLQVLNYVQNLWAIISTTDSPGENEDVYNGAVEAASTLLGTNT